LVYADDVNLLGHSVNTTKEGTETLLQASRNVGLEINPEKMKYMIMSHYLNSGQNQNIRTANESFENVGKERGVYRILVGRPKWKRPLGRSRHRRKDNIKMDLREIGINGAF
jgi:hypothetical protein